MVVVRVPVTTLCIATTSNAVFAAVAMQVTVVVRRISSRMAPRNRANIGGAEYFTAGATFTAAMVAVTVAVTVARATEKGAALVAASMTVPSTART